MIELETIGDVWAYALRVCRGVKSVTVTEPTENTLRVQLNHYFWAHAGLRNRNIDRVTEKLKGCLRPDIVIEVTT